MAGMEFEYDEEGSTFYYFLLSFWTLVIIPSTYYGWPKSSTKDEKERSKRECYCQPCKVKRARLMARTPWIQVQRNFVWGFLILGWVIFFFLVYKVSKIQLEHSEYDPFQILGVDRGATVSEIKKAYRSMSLKYHPDKETGDSKMFMMVAKAYAALTDEESKKNWEEFGNPDGPGVTTFGIALPKWIVASENSTWVLLLYVLVFIVLLPIVVGAWWYRSIKFSKDLVLLDTTNLYMSFFYNYPQTMLKKIVVLLGASCEFDRSHNSEIVERPSDNEEVPQLMKELPDLVEKNKKSRLNCGYSLKARALIHSHFARLELPPDSLELDRRYILQKCPALINEMINVLSQLVAISIQRQKLSNMPRLDTVENCMKLSQMVIQALDAKSSPLLQLPHIKPDMNRHFITKKRNIQHIQNLIAMDDAERRDLLRSLSDSEYRDVMNVCATFPHVDMIIKSEVLDDEDSSITTGSIITVTVTLKRSKMMENFDVNQLAVETFEEQECEEEEEDSNKDDEKEPITGTNEDVKQADGHAESKHKAWQKPTKGKKKTAKPKQKKTKKPYQWKKTAPTGAAKNEPDSEHVKEDDSQGADDGQNEEDNNIPNDDKKLVVKSKSNTQKKSTNKQKESGDEDDDGDDEDNDDATGVAAAANENDDDNWEMFQEESKKENSLETKKKESHPVHCPYFPEEKQEGWWLYVADRRRKMLITAPVQILSLKQQEEVQLKFSAPSDVGIYTYTVVLRSDSLFDFDQFHNIRLDVKEAKVIKEHPQWDISDTEDENQDAIQDASNDSDYSTDEDVSED